MSENKAGYKTLQDKELKIDVKKDVKKPASSLDGPSE